MIKKPVRIFPIIYDRSPFEYKGHPVLHPSTTEYKKYWIDIERNCIEGIWGLDSNGVEGGWRYMPPQLYFYIHIGKIVDEADDGSNEIINPELIDLAWIMGYDWLACRRFSGFENDPEFTCCRIIDKIERKVVLNKKEQKQLEDLKHVTKPDGTYKKYIDAIEYLHKTHPEPLGLPVYENEALNYFLLGSRGIGKALNENEKIRVKDGWTTIKDLVVGDKVYGSDGKLTNVVNKTPLMKNLEMYRITLRDGRTIDCCKDHQWKVWYKNKNKKRKGQVKDPIYSVVDTKEMYKKYYYDRFDSKHKSKYGELKPVKEFLYALPINHPIQDTEKKYTIHPYIVGVLLGDGGMTGTNVIITSADKEVITKVNSLLPEGYYCKKLKDSPFGYSIKRKNNSIVPFSVLATEIGIFGLKSEDKFIPEDYKFGSVEQRLELIKGLNDADGSCFKGNIEYYTVSNRLSDDYLEVVRSLGIQAKHSIKKSYYKSVRHKDCNRIRVYTNQEVFSLKRKLDKYDYIKSKSAQSKYDKVFITNIEKIENQNGYCIQVDNSDSTYITKDHIVTHNSFFAANAMIIHEATFEGAIRYSFELKSKKSEIVVGSAIESKSTDLLQKVDLTMKYLKNNIGSYQDGKKFTPGFFSKPWEGSFYSGKKLKINKYQTKESGEWLDQGDETTIYHVAFTVENPQAAVGKRPSVIVVEEVGLLGNVTTVHGANETAQIRKTKFGSSAYLGTGGNIAKVKESKIIFEDAAQYACLAFKDDFEGRAKRIGRFIPATYTERIFKDPQGNTKIEEAFEYEMQVRAEKAMASTSDSLDEYVQSRPLVPSEMFLAKAGNVFPVAKLRERAALVEVNNLDKKIRSVGHLEYTDKHKDRVKWINDLKGIYKPIVSYNTDRYTDLRGAVVIYEHPPDNIPEPTYRRSLYKVVYDPVKDDNKGTSLASILVYKGFPDSSWEGGFVDTIVAEFIGRYDSVNDMHEIAIKLALYYNAKIMPETNISDFIRYCKMTNKYKLLQPTPTTAISKVIQNPTFKYDVGIDMTSPALITQGEQLAKQWMLTPVSYDENGQVAKTNIDNIYSLRLLDETSQYTREHNFDHTRCLLILAIWLSQETEEPIHETNKSAYKQEIESYFKVKTIMSTKENLWYEY